MNEETRLETYEGLYRSQATDRFHKDLAILGPQGWKVVHTLWDGKSLKITYAYRSKDANGSVAAAPPVPLNPPETRLPEALIPEALIPPEAFTSPLAPRPEVSTRPDRGTFWTPAREHRLSHTLRPGAAIGTVVLVSMLAITGVLMVAGGDNGGPTPTTQPVAEAPAGMTRWARDPRIAWAWSDEPAATCEDGRDWCRVMTVVSEEGCPDGLYVLAFVLGEVGDVIGYASARTESLAPGLRSEMVLRSPLATARDARPFAMTCRGDG